MGRKHVVLWDPRGVHWEGGLVTPEQAHTLRGAGVATLPLEGEFVDRAACAGWSRRAWGSGWPLGTTSMRMACPIVLHVAPDPLAKCLHACVRIVPSDLGGAAEGRPYSGQMSLASDTSNARPGMVRNTATTVQRFAELGRPDEHGGWTRYMGAELGSVVEGIQAFGLYAQGMGLRVAWAAVSQSRE